MLWAYFFECFFFPHFSRLRKYVFSGWPIDISAKLNHRLHIWVKHRNGVSRWALKYASQTAIWFFLFFSWLNHSISDASFDPTNVFISFQKQTCVGVTHRRSWSRITYRFLFAIVMLVMLLCFLVGLYCFSCLSVMISPCLIVCIFHHGRLHSLPYSSTAYMQWCLCSHAAWPLNILTNAFSSTNLRSDARYRLGQYL